MGALKSAVKKLLFLVAIPVGVVAVLVGLPIFLTVALLISPCRPKLLPHLKRDVGFIVQLMGMVRKINGPLKRTKGYYTVADLFAEAVQRFGSKEALTMVSGDSYTFAQLDEASNAVANWGLQAAGLKKGHCVALCMHNCPEFVIFWLGMAKIGVTTALINPNVRGRALTHSLRIAKADSLVFAPGMEVAEAMKEWLGEKEGATPSAAAADLRTHDGTEHIWEFGFDGASLRMFGEPSGAWPVLRLAEHTGTEPAFGFDRNGIKCTAIFLHIYTSGTTGLAKSVCVNHLRFIGGARAFSSFSNVSQRDTIYVSLPMYHSSATVVGIGSALTVGTAVVLRQKFSASQFWKDCADYNATVVQYIGELCRYLVQSPPGDFDRRHNVRMAIGNGLRPDVWETFQARFGIKDVMEFYASTEGNASLINNQNKLGAVGYVSPLIAKYYPVKLVRFDVDTEDVVRDAKTGRCIECAPGEAGELIGLIDMKDMSRRFDGYTDPAATKKRVLRDAFKPGDQWFRTGDLLRRDGEGFISFVDRIGDTFRWKGENVSTAEVATALCCMPGGAVVECAMYGVQVGSLEGRAGMASMVVSNAFSLDAFYAFAKEQLPSYQRPAFLVLRDELEVTTTFKHRKVDQKRNGFDPAKLGPGESLFFRDDAAGAFVPLTPALFREINAGKRRL